MHYKTILALTDLSAGGNEAVQRAAVVAANCGAELRLMYLPVANHPVWSYDEAHLNELARTVAKAAGVRVTVTRLRGTSPEDIAAEANCADLLVLTYRPECQVDTFFKGELHQRVMRLTRCPLLLTRLDGRIRYAKILVAIDFTEAAQQLTVHAGQMDDRAELELFHAVSNKDEAKLRSADVSWDMIKKFRSQQDAYAQKRLHELRQGISIGGRLPVISLGNGEPARQTSLRQQGSGATLIAVGKSRQSALKEFLCGSVSSRVLLWSSSDVLIVPHDSRSSSRAAAKQRIAIQTGGRKGQRFSNT
jgi:nucleotide-binding universal stress UspA family protein